MKLKERDPINIQYPGIKKISFTILLHKDYVAHVGNIISLPDNIEVIVTKVYKRTWWRRLLSWLGIKTKLFNCIKVNSK